MADASAPLPRRRGALCRLPRVKNQPRNADLVGVAPSVSDGVRLMRTSFDIVCRDLDLLWFPVISTGCLALTAGFWTFEGAWLYAVRGPVLLFVPLVVAGLYSLNFVGVFFNVALANAAGEVTRPSATVSTPPGRASVGSPAGRAPRPSSRLCSGSSKASGASAGWGRRPRWRGASQRSLSSR